MSFYVYMLSCSDASYYVGHTDDLEKRIAAHELGEMPGYTQHRRPVRLVFQETYSDRTQAYERERQINQIKGWSRAKKQALVEGDWESLVRLSRSHGSTSSPRAER